MTCQELMKQLEAMGTAQNRKVYARHGAKPPLFGVSYANLYRLQKQIKRDHSLAQELWNTGNSDARALATMIADPTQFDQKLATAWINGCDNYGLADHVASVAAQSKHAQKLAEKWRTASSDWISQAGWGLTARLVKDPAIPDDYFAKLLPAIEAKIHSAKNRTRYAMNTALIAIGCRPGLTDIALSAARRIGKVEVDHGETGCKTPDAVTYLPKAAAYHAKRAARAKK